MPKNTNGTNKQSLNIHASDAKCSIKRNNLFIVLKSKIFKGQKRGKEKLIRRYLAELNKQAKDMFFPIGKRTCRKGRYHGNAQSNRSNKMGGSG